MLFFASLFGWLLLGVLAYRFGYDSTPRLRSAEEQLAMWHVRWESETQIEQGVKMNVKEGLQLNNPVTGERGVVQVAPSAENGRTLVAELFVQPGGAVAGEHVHPHLEEAFTVVRGKLGMRLGGHEVIAPLNKRIVIPAGTPHDWWNAGDEEAQVMVEVRPGDRFLEMISTLFGLAQDGKTNKKGMPNLLQLVLFGKEFEDVLYFTNPPRWVFNTMYTVLGPVARMLGYRGSYPKYLNQLQESPKQPQTEKAL